MRQCAQSSGISIGGALQALLCVCVGGGWGRVAHTIRGGTLQALVVGAGAHTNRQRQRQALRLMTMHPSGWDHPACPGVHQRTWLGSPRVSHTPQTAS